MGVPPHRHASISSVPLGPNANGPLDRDQVLFCHRFDFWFRQCGKIGRFGSFDSSRNITVVFLKIFHQNFDGATLAASVPDQDDLVCRHECRGDFFVEGGLLGNPVTFVVGLLAVNQMMVNVMGIVRLDSDFLFRIIFAAIAEKSGAVVVDNHNHSTRLRMLWRWRFGAGFLEKLAKPRHLCDAEFRGVRTLERFPLRSDNEGEFVASLCLNLAQVPDKLHGVAPMQASRQLAVKQALMKYRHFVMKVLAHSASPQRPGPTTG